MSSSEEAEVTYLLDESVFSTAERELALDEDSAATSLLPNPPVFTILVVAAREGDECKRRAVEEVETGVGRHADCVGEEAREGDSSFVDILGGMERETGEKSEGFTFADILQRADLQSETLLEGVVDTPELPFCVFILRFLRFFVEII